MKVTQVPHATVCVVRAGIVVMKPVVQRFRAEAYEVIIIASVIVGHLAQAGQLSGPGAVAL